MTSASEKNGDRSIVSSVQGTGGSPTEPGPENRVCDPDIGNPGSPVSSGLQVPSEPLHGRVKQDHLGELPAGISLQNVLQVHQQRQ